MAHIVMHGFYLKKDGKEYTIYRDVNVTHDKSVHESFGTTSEPQLQNALDKLSYNNWFEKDVYDVKFASLEMAKKAARTYYGEDPFGLGVRFEVVE
jgi:hypothetical protein